MLTILKLGGVVGWGGEHIFLKAKLTDINATKDIIIIDHWMCKKSDKLFHIWCWHAVLPPGGVFNPSSVMKRQLLGGQRPPKLPDWSSRAPRDPWAAYSRLKFVFPNGKMIENTLDDNSVTYVVDEDKYCRHIVLLYHFYIERILEMGILQKHNHFNKNKSLNPKMLLPYL